MGNGRVVMNYIIVDRLWRENVVEGEVRRSQMSDNHMSDSESAHGPRRSQRERKQVSHFISGASTPWPSPQILTHVTSNLALAIGSSQKRKRDTAGSNDGQDDRSERHLSDADDVSSPDENEHESYGAQKSRGKPATLAKKKANPKAGKRTRVAKDRELKDPSRKSKKAQANGHASNANKIPQDFKINSDNALFSTCQHPSHSVVLPTLLSKMPS